MAAAAAAASGWVGESEPSARGAATEAEAVAGVVRGVWSCCCSLALMLGLGLGTEMEMGPHGS